MKRDFFRLQPGELRWAARWAVVIAVGTMLPYLLAWSLTLQPHYKGWHYTWFIYNPDEPNVHLSWARQGADGKFFQADLFTTEPQKPTFVNFFCSLLGWLTCFTRLPLIFWYHATRVVSAALLLVSIYLLTAYLSPQRAVRQAAFWLAAFSSGFGWLAPYVNPLLSPVGFTFNPVDVSPGLIMPEANTFLSMLLYPLFTFSMCLLVWTFLLALRAMDTGELRWAIYAGLCGLALGNVHTYDAFVVYAVLMMGWLGDWIVRRREGEFPAEPLGTAGAPSLLKRFLCLCIIVALSLPSILYQVWVFKSNPIFRDKALTETSTPLLHHMLFSFGLIPWLAAVGGWLAWKQRRPRLGLASIWAVLNFLILYAPVSFQRKMAEGIHIPLCILAAVGLMRALVPLMAKKRRKSLQRARKTTMVLAVLLTVPSQLAFLRMAMAWVVENNAPRWGNMQPPYFLSDDEWRAAWWLKQNVPADQAILCSPLLGSHLPALTGKFVYVGHWAETLRFSQKLAPMRRFFGNEMSAEEMKVFLHENRIGFVIADVYTLLLTGQSFRPPPFLQEVFRRGNTVVYQLDDSSPAPPNPFTVGLFSPQPATCRGTAGRNTAAWSPQTGDREYPMSCGRLQRSKRLRRWDSDKKSQSRRRSFGCARPPSEEIR